MVYGPTTKDNISLLKKRLRYQEVEMDWDKLEMKEIEYYCRSNVIDFDCFPFSCQIESIICIFSYYGITRFNVDDIKSFYNKMQIPSPRADGIRKPSPSQIRKALDRMKNIQNINENSYEILHADTEIYGTEIKLGYEKEKIM